MVLLQDLSKAYNTEIITVISKTTDTKEVLQISTLNFTRTSPATSRRFHRSARMSQYNLVSIGGPPTNSTYTHMRFDPVTLTLIL